MYIRQQGFTIVEMLVGMAVSLLVMLAVLTVYIGSLRSSSATLGGSRLNQEMAAIMNIMVNDIRRAGYWGTANFLTPAANPFTRVEGAAAGDISALRVHNNGGSGTAYNDVTYTGGFVTSASVGSCITYTYDNRDTNGDDFIAAGEVGDGLLEDDEELGFRWDGTGTDEIKMRSSNTDSGPNSCDDGNWESITECGLPLIAGRCSRGIIVTQLRFDISGSTCINATTPSDCYAVAPTVTAAGVEGDKTVENRQVVITLTAALADAPEVTSTLRQTVQLRNNLIRVR